MRKNGWEEALASLIETVRRKPFVWGQHDCCTFAADAIQAITGGDPMADIRGCYDGKLSALRIIQAEGGIDNHLSTRLSALGAVPVSALFAQRGDIVRMGDDMGALVGVVWGGGVVAPGQDGLVTRGLPQRGAAWHL